MKNTIFFRFSSFYFRKTGKIYYSRGVFDRIGRVTGNIPFFGLSTISVDAVDFIANDRCELCSRNVPVLQLNELFFAIVDILICLDDCDAVERGSMKEIGNMFVNIGDTNKVTGKTEKTGLLPIRKQRRRSAVQ